MDALNEYPIEPRQLEPEVRPPLDLHIAYDELSDLLTVHLYGPPEPAITVPIDDDMLNWRVRPDDHVIVGFEIEYFTDVFLREMPEFIEFADLVGISPEILDHLRTEIDEQQYKRAAVSHLMSRMSKDLVGA